MPLILRRAEFPDAERIAQFNCLMARETEHKELDAATTRRGVERVFGDAAKGFYLVAEHGGEIIGQLMVTYEWSDWRDGWFWWIQSVYIQADFRRQGIFRALFAEIISQAERAGDVVGVRLYVEKQNSRAIATYQDLGMSDSGYSVQEILVKP